MAVDEGKLNEFLGKAVGDLGAAMSAALVLVGDRLGLYRELAKGPLTSADLGVELAAAGIGMKPANCFPDGVTDDIDYFRVGYGESVLPAALEALAGFVEEHRQAWAAPVKAASAKM